MQSADAMRFSGHDRFSNARSVAFALDMSQHVSDEKSSQARRRPFGIDRRLIAPTRHYDAQMLSHEPHKGRPSPSGAQHPMHERRHNLFEFLSACSIARVQLASQDLHGLVGEIHDLPRFEFVGSLRARRQTGAETMIIRGCELTIHKVRCDL
jgi:hypothetical protein